MKKSTLLLTLLPLLTANGCLIIDSGDDHGKEEYKGPKTSYSSEAINNDTVWSGNIHVEGWLDVNAVLKIESCSKISLGPDARITVKDRGRIVAEGSRDCEVFFTSDRAVPEAGDWDGITINSSADKNNKFDFVVLEYANDGLDVHQNISITNSTIAAIKKPIYIDNIDNLKFSNVLFTDMHSVDLMRIHPNMMTQVDTILVDNDNLGRILLDNGYIDVGGTWAVQKAPIVMGQWTNINNDNSEMSLTIKDADLRLPKDGTITVEQAALNLENTIVDWNVKNNNWDAIIYTDKSLDSTIKDCTIKNGNVEGDGFLRLNPGSNVEVSNTKFEDSFDHHKCYFWNESDNLSVNFELNKLYHARDCNSENNNLDHAQ